MRPSTRRAALALLAAVLTATGCSRHVAGPRESHSTRTLVFAQQWEPHSLNPALENGDSSQEWGLLLFSYLVKYGPDGTLIPDVATAVPTLRNGGISRDGRTISYHLRHGVRFADGSPLTARDAAWSIDAVNNPRNDVQSRFGYDDVVSATATGRYTLVVRLRHPFAPLISVVLAPQGFPILPAHLLARYPDFNHVAFNAKPIGSGPYVVRRWARGDRIVLARNPYYWRRRPSIRRIVVRFVANPETAIDMLHTGEIQGFFDDQNPADYPILVAIPGYRVTREPPPQNGIGAIIFNTTDPITRSVRVRRALSEAIDVRSLIAKTYRGAEDSAQAARGLFLWAYDSSAYPDVPYDPARARALLRAAGWRTGRGGVRYKRGRPLDLLLIIEAANPGDQIIGANVVQYERAIGARVTLKAFEVTQFVAPASEGGPVYGGRFQMALYPFENGDDPDTTDQFDCKNVPPNGFNKSRICNRRIDALLAAGRENYDPAARVAIYRRLQRLLYAQDPLLPLYRMRQIDAWSTRLQAHGGGRPGPFWNVGNWYLRTG